MCRKSDIVPQRFWSKVNKTSTCWLWTASCASGYGTFKVGDKMNGAHRASYVLNKGRIPKGLFVLHKCDNKKCVRPSHLFLGTQQDNIDDMIRKGRQSQHKNLPPQKGSLNHGAKLTEGIVKRIKALARKGLSQAEISRRTDVPRPNIWCILHGISWCHVA